VCKLLVIEETNDLQHELGVVTFKALRDRFSEVFLNLDEQTSVLCQGRSVIPLLPLTDPHALLSLSTNRDNILYLNWLDNTHTFHSLVKFSDSDCERFIQAMNTVV